MHLETPEAQNADRRFIRTAMRAALLEPQREMDLARRWRDTRDEAALHELTTAYLRLVVSAATRFRHYGLPISDLVQEGTVGLMQAAARFDPGRGVRFSTYATWWIRASIQDFVLRNWSIVRTGTTAAHKSLFFNLRRLKARISDGGRQQLSREGIESIAKTLQVGVADVEFMEGRLNFIDRSLNVSVVEEAETDLLDLLADERPTPDEVVMEARDRIKRRIWVRRALAVLNPRELTILQARRLQEHGQTLESLGVKLGISKERVRQIEHQALRKVKAALLKQVADPVAAGLIDA
jgi:RNA polymerase sigma-32 factor